MIYRLAFLASGYLAFWLLAVFLVLMLVGCADRASGGLADMVADLRAQQAIICRELPGGECP